MSGNCRLCGTKLPAPKPSTRTRIYCDDCHNRRQVINVTRLRAIKKLGYTDTSALADAILQRPIVVALVTKEG